MLSIALVFVIQYMPYIKNPTVQENRKLASKPELTIQKLDPFPSAYEAWFADHFKLKKPFLGISSFLNIKVFHKANLKNKAIRGKDDYIFEMAKDFPVYTGKKQFSVEELEALRKEFEGRMHYFDSLGIKCYFLLAPNKYSVMNDKLPYLLSAFNHNRTDDFVSELGKISNLPFTDGRAILAKKRKQHPALFRKFDTHWTHLGAYLAWEDLCHKIQNDFPSIPIISIDELRIDTLEKSGGNLCWVMGNDEVCQEIDFKIRIPGDSVFSIAGTNHPKPDDFPYNQDQYCQRYSHVRASNNTKIKALVIHDSFTVMLREIIPAFFDETLFIWDSWKYRLRKEIIEGERPDILIYIVNETYLERILMEPSFVEPMQVDTQIQ